MQYFERLFKRQKEKVPFLSPVQFAGVVMTDVLSPALFSEFSAQDTSLAEHEAQEWIEAVTGRKLKSSLRESLEDGVVLCELMSKLNPGSIRKINKSKSPIAHLDNIQQFLTACQQLGLKEAQLFDVMDLKEAQKGNKRTGVKRNEADRRIRSVCITLYWLGQVMAESEDYTGPQLDLKAFRKIMDGTADFSDGEESNSPISEQPHVHFQLEVDNPPGETQPSTNTETVVNGLTFEQEQTADQLLADIQSAVDEMLLDFDGFSPAPEDTPSSQKSPSGPPENKRLGVSLHMSSRNGGFGFQVVGGVGTGMSPQVELVVQGSPAEDAGLQKGDELVSVNKQDISKLKHEELVSLIKKAGSDGGVNLGLMRTVREQDSAKSIEPKQTKQQAPPTAPPTAAKPKKAPDQNHTPSTQKITQSNSISSNPERTADNRLAVRPPPPSSYGGEPLFTLIEYQEEALLEQINEMLHSITPPASPTPSPPSPAVLSPPDTFAEKPATPELQDDREIIERELQEIVMMEMTATAAAKESKSKAVDEDSSDEQKPDVKPIVKDVKPVVEHAKPVVEDVIKPVIQDVKENGFSDESLTPPNDATREEDPDSLVEQQIAELLHFAGFEPVPKLGDTPTPPLTETPPPPMPKSEPPKRQAKKASPPLVKPKPSKKTTKHEKKPEHDNMDSNPPAAPKASVLSEKTRIATEHKDTPVRPTAISNGPVVRQKKEESNPGQPRPVFTPPPPPTSSPPPQSTITPINSVRTLSPAEEIEMVGNIKISCVQRTRWTPKNSESKTPTLTPEQQLMKRLSYNQPSPVNDFQARRFTSPDVANYHHHQQHHQQLPNGNLSRDEKFATISASTYHLPQNHTAMHSSVAPGKRTQWRSQEELRIKHSQPPSHHQHHHQQHQPSSGHYPAQQHSRVQRLMSSPAGSYGGGTYNKTKSLPRDRMAETWKKNKSNTWAVRDRSRGGPQIAYAVRANSPHELCSRCHLALGNGAVMAIPGTKAQYHVQCFVCRVCQSPLVRGAQNTTVVVKDMHPHCGFCVSNKTQGVLTTEC